MVAQRDSSSPPAVPADPEKKRKIIGRMFVEVFDEEAAKLEDVKAHAGLLRRADAIFIISGKPPATIEWE